MNKLLKIVLIVVGAVVVLSIAAVIAVAVLFDANAFRGRISAQVKDATGRELSIEDIRLSIFPTLGARIRNAKLGNAAGFGDAPFAQIGEVDVGVRLVPLIFHRQMQVGSVTLKDAQINLIKNADGRTDWEGLVDNAAAKAGEKPAPEQPPPKAGAPADYSNIEVASVDIVNAGVAYDDRQAHKKYAVSKFNLKTGALSAHGSTSFKLSFSTALSDPQIDADVSASAKLAADLPAKVYQLQGLELQVKASGSGMAIGKQDITLKGEARYDGGKNTASLSNLVLKADPSTITGNIDISNLATQAVQFALKVDQIDVDRYLPPRPPAQERAQKPLTGGAGADDNKPLPTDALDALNATGTIDIGRLTFKGMKMSNVQLRLTAPKGAEKRVGVNAALYGGTLASDTRIATGARPSYGQSAKLAAVDLGALLKDYKGKDSVSGVGNISLAVTSAGRTIGEVKHGLNGDLSFSLRNGAIKGFNLAQLVRQGQAVQQGKLAADDNGQTDFSAITGTGKIRNGVLHSDDLLGESPLLRLQGSGDIDLGNNSINYLVKPTLVNTTSGQGGKQLAQLQGVVVPVRITGTLSDPKYQIDVAAALQQKVVQQLGQKLGDKGGILNQLGNLFGNKQQDQQNPPKP